jgi:Transposase IS116/IS110/IS902 family
MLTLVEELTAVVAAVGQYREALDAFFAGLPEAQWIRTLPIGDPGVTAPTLWALLGDAPRRWESWQHRQGHAGTVPVTIRSGQQRIVRFRSAWDTAMRYVVEQVAVLSLRKSEWARAYYDQQRARGPRSSSGSAGVGRQVVEDHLRDVGPSNPIRRAASSGDDDTTAIAAEKSEKGRLTWTRESLPRRPAASRATASAPWRKRVIQSFERLLDLVRGGRPEPMRAARIFTIDRRR